MSNLIDARINLTYILLVIVITSWLSACSNGASETEIPSNSVPTVAPTAEAALEEVAPPPTVTSAPLATPTPQLAALVNQRPILLTLFEQKLARYEQAQSNLKQPLEEGYRNRVFLDLVEQEILQQTAEQWQIEVTSEMAQSRLNELMEQSGGTENFEAWLEANQTDLAEFTELIRDEMLAAEILAQVTADVPYEVPHIRASYLEVADFAQAEAIVAELSAGSPFATAAQNFSLDRATGENGGDLGYFAAGFLLVPELEVIAWQLNVGEISQIITVTHPDNHISYYLITVTEAAAPRPLSEGQRAQLLQKTFERWLAEQLATAEIVRFVE